MKQSGDLKTVQSNAKQKAITIVKLWRIWNNTKQRLKPMAANDAEDCGTFRFSSKNSINSQIG